MLYLTVDVLERFPEARERWHEGLPLHPRRRVPGHEPRAVPAAPAARADSTGTSAPSATRTSRSTPCEEPTSATSSTSSATSPDAHGRARAELPLDELDPPRRERRHREQQRAQAEEPLVRARRGRADRGVEVEDEHAEARFVAAEIAALVEEGFSGSEIAVFYRMNAQSRVLEDVLVRQGDRVPGDRRAALLRARGDQGRDRVPPGDRQPVRRRLADAHREPAAPRHRRHVDRAARDVRGRARDLALGGARPRRRGRRRSRAVEGGASLHTLLAVADVAARRS